MKNRIPLIAACMAATAVIAQVATQDTESKSPDVVRAPGVIWGALNPARGAKGPRAGTLWNDRTKEKASGFLVKFSDGFSSPPHIHNVTYRGVVISGLVHNDDPDAKEMWMPPGSFWTQPAGEVHITAAKGKEVTAYIEIDSGPYLVLPKEEAFDKGEKPINIVPSNIVWLSASQTTLIENPSEMKDGSLPEIAFLWGKPAENTASGSFIRLPAGFDGELHSGSGPMRVVIVKGSVVHGGADSKSAELMPGDYLGLSAAESERLRCGAGEGCVAYIHSAEPYRVKASSKKE